LERLRQVVRQIPEVMGPETGVALLGGEPLAVPWALDLAREIVALGPRGGPKKPCRCTSASSRFGEGVYCCHEGL